MTTKQLPGGQSKDGSKYGTPTNGNNSLALIPTSTSGGTKPIGLYAKDGSIYVTLTDGNNNLT